MSGSVSSPAPVVSGAGVPPVAGTRHSVRLPARAEEKTMDRPSGVQLGHPPSHESNVSWRAWPPAAGMTQISPAMGDVARVEEGDGLSVW